MRALVVALVLLASPVVDAAGKTVDLDFTQVVIRDVLRLLGDIGKVNIVILEGEDAKIDVKVKRVRWDTVLADVVAKANLAFVREGNVVIVGAKAAIDARKTTKRTRASGPLIDVDLVGASAKDASYLVAVASATPFQLDGGNSITMRLRKTSLSVAKDLLALQSQATVTPTTTKQALARVKGACVAPKLPVADLEPIAILGIGTKRWAMLGTKTSAETFVISPVDCLGVEGTKVKSIAPTFIELDGNVHLSLYPPPRPL